MMEGVPAQTIQRVLEVNSIFAVFLEVVSWRYISFVSRNKKLLLSILLNSYLVNIWSVYGNYHNEEWRDDIYYISDRICYIMLFSFLHYRFFCRFRVTYVLLFCSVVRFFYTLGMTFDFIPQISSEFTFYSMLLFSLFYSYVTWFSRQSFVRFLT